MINYAGQRVLGAFHRLAFIPSECYYLVVAVPMIQEDMQVIVCGPNRSGTSLMMRCLEMAGFKMAEDLTPGDKGNIYGYYESERFMDLCYEVFSSLNLAKKPDLGVLRWRASIDGLKKLLDKKGRWAWKAPFAVFILDELFEAGENVIAIYMSRPKADVVSSWIRFCEVKGFKDLPPMITDVKSLVGLYDQSLEAFQAYRYKKLEVHFLELVEDEKKVMNEVFDFLGLEANYDCTAVDSGQVHFRSGGAPRASRNGKLTSNGCDIFPQDSQ